jgi:hypothetical protein
MQKDRHLTRLLHFWTTSLALTAMAVHGQTTDQIGQLKFTDCKIKKTETTVDTIVGFPVKVTRLTITAKTKVQVSCSYGHPEKNEYKTVDNKVTVSYAYDSTGIIYDSIFSEIKKYVSEQEEWANTYSKGNPDFSYLPFNKSFFIQDSTATPFIWTGAERSGDYQIFYVNKRVYKIKLIESNGLGGLSSFVRQNSYFIKDDKKLNLRNYIKNIEQAKAILAKK